MASGGNEPPKAATESVSAKVRGYVAKEEVKEVYEVIKVSAKFIDGVNFLAKPEVMETLSETAPSLASSLGKVSELAKALGPAGVALGVATDLLVAFGLVEEASLSKLNQISQQIEDLKSKIQQGFDDLKLKLEEKEALLRFLPVYDNVLAYVGLFEQIVIGSAIEEEQDVEIAGNSSVTKVTGGGGGVVVAGRLSETKAEILYKNLELLMEQHKPMAIIEDLEKMHNLIVGKTVGFGKPLFEQLALGANRLEGKEVDNFISNLLLQFQAVVALEMRAVRMLRSFVALQQQDTVFAIHFQAIFKHLAMQCKEYDPTHIFEWYLRFKASGCTTTMTTAQWPNWNVVIKKLGLPPLVPYNYLIEGSTNYSGDEGVFILTPTEDDKFLISSKKWPDRYIYMAYDIILPLIKTYVGDPGPQGHWFITVKDVQKRTFVMRPAKWPQYYVFMGGAMRDGKLMGCKGDPGPQGYFILQV